MIKAVLIDNSNLTRLGICALLEEKDAGIQILAAANQEKSIELVRSLKPDVVMICVDLEDALDLRSIIKLLSKEYKILVISRVHDFFSPIFLNAGAFSYLSSRTLSAEKFITAIKETVANKHIIHYQSNFDRSQFPDFSVHEIEIIQATLLNMSIQKIAQKLNLSPATVCVYWARILHKLNIKKIVHLAIWAIKKKIISIWDLSIILEEKI